MLISGLKGLSNFRLLSWGSTKICANVLSSHLNAVLQVYGCFFFFRCMLRVTVLQLPVVHS